MHAALAPIAAAYVAVGSIFAFACHEAAGLTPKRDAVILALIVFAWPLMLGASAVIAWHDSRADLSGEG